MNRRRDYRVLIVRTDGGRVLQLNVPGRAIAAGLLAGTVTVAGIAGVAADWWHLRTLTSEARSNVAELARVRSVADAVNRRIAELGREAAEWRALHARIWHALGPDTSSASRVPGVGGRTVSAQAPTSSRASDLRALADSIKDEAESLRALDQVMQRAGKLIAALPMRWPVRGTVNSEYGSRESPWSGAREFHTGIDIGARGGTAIRAPAPGIVEYAGTHADYGLYVVIDHGHDVKTVYGHLSQISGRRGERIERGGLVGFTGNTGRSSGPHLHYEVLVNGRPVNPRAYLWD